MDYIDTMLEKQKQFTEMHFCHGSFWEPTQVGQFPFSASLVNKSMNDQHYAHRHTRAESFRVDWDNQTVPDCVAVPVLKKAAFALT